MLGDTSAQKALWNEAIVADPTTPDLAWQAANFYVVQGETDKAMHEFRVVMDNDPTLPAVAMPLVWRIEPNIDALLHDVIPPMASVYSSFLEYLVGRKESAAANKVWARLAPLQQPVERPFVFKYIRSLLLEQEVDQARIVWQQAANLVRSCRLPAHAGESGHQWQFQPGCAEWRFWLAVRHSHR